MSNSTTNLDQLSTTQSNKEVVANALFDAFSPAGLWGRRASTTSGLTWGYYGGNYQVGNASNAIANGTVTLTASTTNYVYANAATGAVSVNTTGAPAGSILLYTIVTGTTTVTNYTDNRAFQVAGSSTLSNLLDFSNNAATTTGLTYGYNGGTVSVDNVSTAVAAGTVALTASTTNYVQVSSAGVVSANTTGFVAGQYQMAQVVTGASTITTITDKRSVIRIGYGTMATQNANSVAITGGTADLSAVPTATSAQLTVRGASGALSTEGKQRFYGTFGSGTDYGQRMVASLRSGFNAGTWGTEYLDFWLNSASNDAFSDANQSRVMRLAYGGRILVGAVTDDGSSLLQVNGAAYATNFAINRQGTGDAGTFGFGNANGPGIVVWGSATAAAGALVINTAGAERARVVSAGRMLIGTTTDDGVNLLQVNGTIKGINGTGALYASNGSGASQTSVMIVREGGPTDQKKWELLHDGSGNFVMRAVNDAYSAATMVLQATRGSGVAVASLTVGVPLILSQGTLLQTNVALTNGAAAQTATLTNGPTAGNPTKWIPINDNGTTRYIPAW